MSSRLELCSFLRRHVPDYEPDEGIELPLHGPATVREVIEGLGIPLEEVHTITVNRKMVGLDHVIKNGEVVGLFSILVGG